MSDEERREREGVKPSASGRDNPIRIKVEDMLKGAREAIIELDGKDYRLRITGNGKLILTK